jgi:hypothetical protein
MEDFIIYINYKDRDPLIVLIEDDDMLVSDLMERVIRKLELPKATINKDNIEVRLEYKLALENSEMILLPVVNNDHKTLLDYGVKPGDELTLIGVPWAGCHFG